VSEGSLSTAVAGDEGR